jgi:hypothetical protein
VLVLRCTRKLLARVGPPVEDPPPSTTALGDWYAQPLGIGRQRFILLISEHSRLPVLMPALDAKNLPRNLPEALWIVLLAIGVPQSAVEHEIEQMDDVVIAKTNSRSHLGTLNDFSNMLWHTLPQHPEMSLIDHALWLADTPVRPLMPVGGWPHKVTRSILG